MLGLIMKKTTTLTYSVFRRPSRMSPPYKWKKGWKHANFIFSSKVSPVLHWPDRQSFHAVCLENVGQIICRYHFSIYDILLYLNGHWQICRARPTYLSYICNVIR
jgi:hypothetical protein